MTIDRFSKEKFESVLADAVLASHALSWHCEFVGGEFEYDVLIRTFEYKRGGIGKVVAKVRSSISLDGFADPAGENSIRIWLSDGDDKPLGKLQRWVARTPGWEDRFMDLFSKVVAIGRDLYCARCDSLKKLYVVRKEGGNKGRLFTKCNCLNSFSWLDDHVDTDGGEKEDESLPKCPKCNSLMVLREGKFGKFYGCSNYPTCKGTRSYTAEKVVKEKEKSPSKYQLDVFSHIMNKPGRNLVVEAVAGSGKTWTVVEALKLFPSSMKVIYVAFNRHIVKELIKRVPGNAKIGTYHSIGFSACKKAWGNDIVVDNKKVDNILDKIYPRDVFGSLYPAIRQVVSLMKANLYEPCEERFNYITDRYGIETNGDSDTIYQAVLHVMKVSVEMTNVLDYDDMVWLPVVCGLHITSYDVVLIDEAQDTNRNQIELAKMMVKDGGKVVAVGDRNQSLYGFRGADVDAIPNLISELEADTLPLSITYRCPMSIVRLVNDRFPDISFEAAPEAVEGQCSHISFQHAFSMFKECDMVLCRTNAPLVAPVFELIRAGRKAVIIGTDIGKGLISLLEKMKAETVHDLLINLDEYKRKEMDKLLLANKASQAASLADKVETLVAISDGCYTMQDVVSKIESVFSDSSEGVTFSSVHRAKGLQADRVFLLRPELMPHPMAQKDWEMQQEENIEYVAVTRTLKELYYVHGE